MLKLKEITGNIARVKEKILNTCPHPVWMRLLQGKAAGVFVNSQSGKLGPRRLLFVLEETLPLVRAASLCMY